MNDSLKKVAVPEIIANANVHFCGTVYSNHAQFVIINNELFLDFYLIEPAKPEYTGTPAATLVSRIAVPIGMAKGIATGLANAIDRSEKSLKIKIPNQRGKHPGDSIEIWKED
ncbi:MAG: hypothetical protein Q8N39_04240 [Pelolinea sp.]|nr:hypothetical protein [Pelolinea sp.]